MKTVKSSKSKQFYRLLLVLTEVHENKVPLIFDVAYFAEFQFIVG